MSGRLNRQSSVAALVPHFHCEQWLADSLASLVEQTRPLDAIVVIDDASGNPPVDIVRQFPQVILLQSVENVGPYRIKQQVIDDTDYDAYLFQDADDWSSMDRLAVLLAEAENTGAELVGCQEVLISCDTAEVQTVNYPLEVNAALQARPSLAGLLHPTSVVSRDLVLRLGGFATGLRFSADREFLLRAVHVARVRNVPNYCYFRRRRDDSLTMDPSTGMKSPARKRLREILAARAQERARAVAQGKPVALAPYVKAGPIALRHLAGPTLGRSRAAGAHPVASPLRQSVAIGSAMSREPEVVT